MVLFAPELAACPKEITAIIEEIAREPATTAVWLLGSRANGTATTKSDWDVLVFSAVTSAEVCAASFWMPRADLHPAPWVYPGSRCPRARHESVQQECEVGSATG